MPDREKVIEGLKELCEYLFHEYKVCYHGDEDDTYNRFLVANNALELLKEQEPKTVKIMKNAYNHEFYYCPRCDRGFEDFFRKPMFCDKCGQAVKWDD